MLTDKEWIVSGALVAFVLIPICWKFWKKWDRPSLASLFEMKRRIQERDIREAFIEEDAKVREQQRLEAAHEMARRKAQAPTPVEKTVLNSAFSNLGGADSTGTAVLPESVPQNTQSIVASVENVGELVDSLDTDGIDEVVVPEAYPVAVQLQGDAGADEVKWDARQDEDDWSDIQWS
ncbi:MAG: hypothetical protein QF684_00420 [Candidatus Thalassarchaeaceae archaeon]|nr:hypothetical protein [Candidatus Thalassarchaeaceae archaeon]